MAVVEGKVTLVDSTHRLEWEITKEEFQNCEFGQKIKSPEFNVQMGNENSKWKISMWPKGFIEENRNEVCLGFQLNSKDVSYAVKYGCAFKTEGGYWPNDLVKLLYENNFKRRASIFDKLIHKRSFGTNHTRGVNDLFIQNKQTLVLILVIYGEGRSYLKHKKLAENYVHNVRSISKNDSFSDFTVLCRDKRIKCLRSVLAAMSSVFETMLTNDMFSEKHENCVKIEDSPVEIVEAMIKFMSSGVIPKDIDSKAMDLIYLADKYNLKDLIEVCEDSLAENLSADNVIETLIVLDRHVPKSEHRKKILAFIKDEAAKVVKVPDWRQFVQNYPDLVTEIFLASAIPPSV